MQSELCSLEGRAARLVADAEAAMAASDAAERAALARVTAAREKRVRVDKVCGKRAGEGSGYWIWKGVVGVHLHDPIISALAACCCCCCCFWNRGVTMCSCG